MFIQGACVIGCVIHILHLISELGYLGLYIQPAVGMGIPTGIPMGMVWIWG